MNPFILRNSIFPAYHSFKRTGLNKRLKELRENQWKSKDDLYDMQQHKLKELLVHAYRSVPYYREKLNENGIDIEKFDFSDDFQKIPLLTKKEINENRNLMISNEVNRDSLLSNSTSGSTGEALYFYYDMRSWAFRSAVVIRNQEAIGIRIGDRAAKLWGAPMDLNAAATIRGKIHAWVNNNLFLSSYDLADSNLELYTKRILKHRPKFIISYPGPIVVLAEYLIKNRVTIPSVQSIICSAETAFPVAKRNYRNSILMRCL